MNLSLIQDQAQLSNSNRLEMANDYSKATTSKSVFLLYKNRVWMGKTRIAPNALKIELESYDTNL